jgi:integrase
LNRRFNMDPPSSRIDPGTPVPPLQTLLERARDFAEDSRAPSTRRAYGSDLAAFAEFCRRNTVPSLPASTETVAAFLAHLVQGRRKASTIARALTAIAAYHVASGFPSPRADALVRDTLRGIRRRLGTAPARKAPLVLGDLRTVLTAIPDTIAGARDTAILLLGFWGALRRAELVAVDVEDLEFAPDGLRVHIRRAKNDALARGRTVAIPNTIEPVLCTSLALKAWLTRAGITSGPLFRSMTKTGRVLSRRLRPGSVATIVKGHVAAIGGKAANYGGHSLRRGFATSAARAGLSDHEIARQTGHGDLGQLRAYVVADDDLVSTPLHRFRV